MKLRIAAVLAIVFLAWTGAMSALAQENQAEGPADCGAYQAQTPTDEPNCGSPGELPEGVYESGEDGLGCPKGYGADGPNTLCYPVVEEDLNAGWYDDQGNLVPSQGECPEGYFVWESPANGLDHDICSVEAEDISGPVNPPVDDSTPEDKGVYPVIGPAYVVGTNGEGVICRDAPNGQPIFTLPEGTEVMELADGAQDGWQMVAYQESETVFPSCFVSASYLGTTPEPKDSDAYQSGVDTGSTDEITLETSNNTMAEPAEEGEAPLVSPNGLPNTGTGPLEAQPSLTEGQRTAAIAAVVIIGAFLALFGITQLRQEP